MNHLDKLVQQVAQDAAREAAKGEIQAFAKRVMVRFETYLGKPQPDPKASLIFALLAEILSESAGLEAPLPEPIQQRPRYRAQTPEMEWTNREQRQAQKSGVPIWLHSQENGGNNG
jgi:hypothetical protein